MAWYYNDTLIRPGKAWVDSNDNKYYWNWYTEALPTDEDRIAAGLTWVDDPQPVDSRFYSGRDENGDPIEWNLEDVNEVDTNGDPVLDADGNQLVRLGLKSLAIPNVKNQAQGLLAPTDWMVIKAAEVADYTVPADVTAYRAAVRQASNDIEAAINACTTLTEFVALYDVPVGENGLPAGNAPIYDWPDPID